MNLTEKLSGLTDKIKEQELYQQFQSSFEQLSPEQQTYVKWGSLGAGVLLFFYLAFSSMESANSLKDEYFEKQGLQQLLNQAGDEIRRLKGQNSGFTQGAPLPWKIAFQNLATGQGIGADAIEVIKESPGVSQNVIQETLLEVQIKGVALHPLIQMLYQVEHGTPPMKLKGIQIQTNAGDGTLNAKLNVSGFTAKPEKTDKK